MTDFILIDGEAFTPEELERRQNRKPRRTDPAYWREYRRRKGDEYRAYQREYQRRSRTYRLTDEELESKIRHHQKLIDRYSRELVLRRKEAA